MRFSLLPLAAGLLPFASAYITGLAPFTGTYKADDLTTMFPVTFNTGSTKVLFSDLSVNFGLTTLAEHTSDTVFGKPLINIDLVQFKRDGGVCCAPFTINIPLNSADLYNGPGTYVLTAAIVRITGDSTTHTTFRADPFSITFNATTA